jgi:hypothetical protein
MKHQEDNLQMACVRWFDYQYPKYRILLHHSPNGGKRDAREAGRFKAMGVRPGFPDLFLAVPSSGYHGLFIELKAGKNNQTDTQIEFETRLKEHGYSYCVVRSVEEFISEVVEYL